MQSKNAIGNLINRYKAVLKKCRLLNTFGSLAVASMLVAGGVGVAYANNVNIGDPNATGNNVSLKAEGGSPADTDKVTTEAGAAGDFNLNIDDREPSLYTMTIGADSLGGNLTVILQKGTGTATSITSNTLSVVADKDDKSITTKYIISDDLTHTVDLTQIPNSTVSIQGSTGKALLQVDGTLTMKASDDVGASISGGTGTSSTSLLNVSGTLNAMDSTGAETALSINGVTATFNDATVNATSLTLDAHTTLTLAGYGYTTINAYFTAENDITIDDSGLNLTAGGNLAGLTLMSGTTTNHGILKVCGNGKVVTVSDLKVTTYGTVYVRDGATLDISNDTDTSDAFKGVTSLEGGTLKVAALTIAADKLVGGESTGFGEITFDPQFVGNLLSVVDTLTLGGDGTLESGVNVETKNLAGVDTEVESGATLDFTGGGSIGTDVSVGGVVNIEGTDEFDVTATANQTNITDTKTLLLNGGTINVQNNAVLVLDNAADLNLTVERSGAGKFNVQNTAALLLSDLDFFNGQNLTNIAGVVNSVDAQGAAQYFFLSNVNLQDGAQLGTDTTDVRLSGIINVDATDTDGVADAQILGNLDGNGVTGGEFNGTLNVGGSYSSNTTNTFGDADSTGILNINGNQARFGSGANDVFNVVLNVTNAVVINGGNNGSGSASVTINAGGTIGKTSGSLNIKGGAGGATDTGGDATFTVGGGEYIVNGHVEITAGAAGVAAGGSAILNVKGLDATSAAVTAETKLTVTGDVDGTGVLNVIGGAGADGANYAGGNVALSIGGDVDGVTINYTGGAGGDGGANAGEDGGAGGSVTVADISNTYTLTGGDGGDADNLGAGGKGGSVILNATDGKTYTSITLIGGDAGESTGDNAGAGGNAIFNVTNESITAEEIIMSTAETSIVNVIVDADATNPNPPAQDTTLSVKKIDGTDVDTDVGASGVINITGTNEFTATLTVTGDGNSYIDDNALEVNIGLNGTLDLGNMQFGNLGNFLSGAYNLDGGTLNLGGLRIDAEDLVSGSADAGEIGFNASNGGKLDVDGLLTIRNATATAQLNDGVYIETQSLIGNLTGEEGVTHILLGKDGSTADSTLTFTGGGEIQTALTVAGNVDDEVGGIVNIIAEKDADGAFLSGADATTTAIKNISIDAGGVLNVQENAVLSLEVDTADPDSPVQVSVTGDGSLNVMGGTLNAVTDDLEPVATDLVLGNVNINLSAGGTLGTAGTMTTLGAGTVLNLTNSSGYIVGDFIAAGVNAGEFNGTLHFNGNYYSAGSNTFGTANANGALYGQDNKNPNIMINANGEDFQGNYVTAAGDRNDIFNVNVRAGNVTVRGGDENTFTADATFNKELKVTATVSVQGGDGGAGVEGGAASMTVNGGGYINNGLNVTGGNNAGSAGGNATFTVGGGDFTILNGVSLTNGAHAGGSAILNVKGLDATSAAVTAETKLTITGDVDGTGAIHVIGGAGSAGTGFAGGDVALNIDGDVEGVIINYTGGDGGDGGANAGEDGGDGGSVTVADISNTYTLTGGTGGNADNLGAGGKGGSVILNATDGKTYTSITLEGGDAGESDGDNGGAGGSAIFNVTNESITANNIDMSTAETSIVNVTVDADATSPNPPAQNTTLSVRNIDGAGGASGVINIIGTGNHTATLTVTDGAAAKGVYNDSDELVVNIGAYGKLDLTDAQVNIKTGENALEGAYNLNGGTLEVNNLTINASGLHKGDATAGQIAFDATDGGTLSINDTLTLDSNTAENTVILENGVNIETKTLRGGVISNDNPVIAATVAEGAKITFTGGGSMQLNVAVNGTVNIQGSGTAGIGAVNQTNIIDDIILTLNAGSVVNVQDNGVLVMDGTKRLNLTGGEFNIADDGTLILKDFDFDGKNITNIAGTVIAVENLTATTLNYQDLNLANVDLQAGAKLGNISLEESIKDTATTLLSGTINVDANSTDNNAVTVFGNLRGNGVIDGDFNGTLNVTGDYLSAAGNTFAGTGMMDVANDMEFTNGANDLFNVNVEAENVNVTGIDNKSSDNPNQADAGVTFAKNLTVTGAVTLLGGDATTANGGTTQMIVAGVLKAENVSITGGTNTDNFTGGGSQLVVDGGVTSSITNLTIKGGDVDDNMLASSMNNAEFVVQTMGNLDNRVTIDNVTIDSGDNAFAAPTYGQGVAAFIVAGGNYENGGEGRQTYVKITETVIGDGIIVVQGGTGETGGSGEGGTAKLDINNADLSQFTGTYSYQGGTGGDATNVAGGGKGGVAEIDGDNAQSYDLVGGTGGDASGEFAGGAGGNALLSADSGNNYAKVTLTGGVAGADAEASGTGLGGAGGDAKFSIGNVESTVNTLIVNNGGTVEVTSFNDDPATLTVNDDFTDIAGAQIIVIGGTLDLSAATINNGTEVLAGAYNVRGNSKLVLENLSIDAADLVSGISTPGDGQVSIIDGGMLVVKDTLTIGGNDSVDANAVNITTQSLAAATGTSTVTFDEGTLTFSGGTAPTGTISAIGTIDTDLTIDGTAQMVVDYTEDTSTNPATIIGTTTLNANNTLTINNSGGLNILGGATLDVSDGTLIVGTGGFAHLDPDALKQPNVLGEPGLGTLIVDNNNLGFSAIEGNISYNDSANKVADAFWGALHVTGLEGDTLSLEEYNKLLVDGENALIQGKNATLELVDVDVEGLFVLSSLKAGTVKRVPVEIGTGVVDHGGTIIVGSVKGDYIDSIIIENGSDVSITGEPDGGALYTQIGDTGQNVQVKDGTLRLGGDATGGTATVTENPLTLGTDIVLGAIGATAIDNTTGNLYVYGDLDMSAQTISSLAGTSGNTVNVVSGGTLTTQFDLGAGDALNVLADTASATVDVLGGSELGDLNITGGTVADAHATVNINGTVTADGNVTLTGNVGDAILNIVGGSDNAENTKLSVNGNFTNNGGILNLTAGDATATGDGGSAELSVVGTFTSTTGDINLTGGDASGANNGGNVYMSLGTAALADVTIASGADAAGATGFGGTASFTLNNGNVADVTVTSNSAANNINAGFVVDSGWVVADSVTLDTATGAGQAYLGVDNAGSLTVGKLDASGSDVKIDDGRLTVTGTYADTANTDVFVYDDGLLELSVTTDKVVGSYDVFGTLQMDTLNIASDSLVDGANITAAGDIAFYRDGTLKTTTLNLTDATTATLDYGNIMTSTLNTTGGVNVTVDTALTFTGGGSINADLSTDNNGMGSIVIGTVAGVDGRETAATTTTLGKGMTLDINNVYDTTTETGGLLILEGNALNTALGTLKVVTGGFASTGTGQLTANNQDFGAFTFTDGAYTSFNGTNANVGGLYYGDLVLKGLTGTMDKDEYESFLIKGNNALIQGDNATLKFEGVSVKYADDVVLKDLPAGTNADDQIFETGNSATGTNIVDVNNGGKVIVGGVTDATGTVTSLTIKTGTTLGITGQGEARGDAFYGDVIMENGAGFETGAAGGQYDAHIGGDVVLNDGGSYTAVGNTIIEGEIRDDGSESTGGQSFKVEGAHVTMGTNGTGGIYLPGGSMTMQPGSNVAAGDVTIKELYLANNTSLIAENLTVNSGQIESGSMTVEGTANITAFTFGSGDTDAPTNVSIATTNVNGVVGWDPAWNADPKRNTMQSANQGAVGTVTFNASATGEVGMYVGRNSMVAVGTKDTTAFMNDLQQLVDKGVITWGNPTDDKDNTSAAIAFYEGLTLTDNASLVVNGEYVNDDESTNPAGVWELSDGTPVTFTANTAIFAANSLTMVDATGFLAPNSVVLTAGTGSTLTVNYDAKLVISGGKGGQYINVAEGFDTVTNDKNSTTGEIGWIGDNLISSSSLIEATVVTGNAELKDTAYADSDFVVKLTSITANNIYTALTPSMSNHIDNMVLELGINVDSLNAGQNFISRLIDNSGKYGYGSARHTEVASIIESAAQMAQVGAVNRGIMDAAMSAGNASIARNTFTELGANAQNVATVHMGEGGGISTGSEAAGMKNGLGLWLMPLYKWNNVSGFEAGSFEHDYTSGLGGMAIGADYTVNNMFRFGVSFNLGAGYAESTGDLSHTDNSFDFWGVGVYGAFSQNNFNIVADFGYTETYNELNQKVPSSLGMGNNSVDVNASAFTFGLTAEYVIKTDAVDIIPHAGVRFMSVSTEDYDVKNGGTVFEVENETQNVWYFPVGITFQKDVAMDNGWHFTPKLDLGFIAAAGDLDAVSKASIPGVSGAAELEMRNVDGFAFNGGLGFDLGNDVVTFGINYNIQASEHETGHMISGTLRFDF